jgi:hypothetical protein
MQRCPAGGLVDTHTQTTATKNNVGKDAAQMECRKEEGQIAACRLVQ